MNASDIEQYLAELGKELVNLGIEQSVRVLLLGGAFMLTQIRVRRTTDDIDVLPLIDEEGENIATIAIALWNASHAVAEKQNLPDRWLNTLIADFIRAAGPAPIQTLWRTYGPLEVYLPPKEYILVLKLLANRKKDQRDIKALFAKLKITTRGQAQVLIDSYIPDPALQQLTTIPDTLEDLFPPT